MRTWLWLLCWLCLPAAAVAQSTAHIYVCAHPDDCILFMNPNLYDDAKENTERTVVLYVTSGDAGEPFAERPNSYPFSRELASRNATNWMTDHHQQETSNKETYGWLALNKHRLFRTQYGPIISYFLRIPDGNMYGEGFEHYGFQSLQKLQRGEIPNLNTIDGKNTYQNWADLSATLRAIIEHEVSEKSNISLHLADTDAQTNIGDHSDHTHAAEAMLQALQHKEHEPRRCFTLYKHIGYHIADKEPNLDNSELEDKSGSFAALTAIQQSLSGKHNWDEAHTRYLARNYYTRESYPEDCHNAE